MSKKLTHEEFVEKLLKKNQHFASGEFELVGQYVGSNIHIACHCNIHNANWSPLPVELCRGQGCPYCAGNRVLIGFNDLWTTRPDVAQLLQDVNDGYKYTCSSKKKTWFVCPDCGTPSLKVIGNVSFHGFGCTYCSDGISYPNKFGRAFLKQMGVINHQCEYNPDWLKPYRFDNYFEYNNQKYVLEMDGELGHGNKKFRTGEPDVERIKTDMLKDSLARKHGINVIRINCIKSDVDYIRENICRSELSNIFDLSVVNWNLCDQTAQKNVVKEVCRLYMKKQCTLIEIGEQFNIHPDTIGKYLRKGQTFGWCDYTTDIGRKRAQLGRMKPVIVIDSDDNIIYSFTGVAPCCVEMAQMYGKQFLSGNISIACKTHKPYKGFNFRFANETIQN